MALVQEGLACKKEFEDDAYSENSAICPSAFFEPKHQDPLVFRAEHLFLPGVAGTHPKAKQLSLSHVHSFTFPFST